MRQLAARYLVAKYIEDEMRMEPRNIGVVLWCNGQVMHRFLPPKPKFVDDKELYSGALQYWEYQLSGESLRSSMTGETKDVSSPDCLDVVLDTPPGRFSIVDGGFVPDSVPKREAPRLLEYLFDAVVEYRSSEKKAAASWRREMEQQWEKAISESGIAESPLFESPREITCPVSSTAAEKYVLDYACGKTLFKYVTVPQVQSGIRTIHDVGWIFRNIIATGSYDQDRCCAVTYVPPEVAAANECVRLSLDILRGEGQILNVHQSEYSETVRKLSSIAASVA